MAADEALGDVVGLLGRHVQLLVSEFMNRLPLADAPRIRM